MKKISTESTQIALHISVFLNEYAANYKTSSGHTLKSYHDTLTLYLGFLETEKGISPARLGRSCFERPAIEEWLLWMQQKRGCSPGTCNVRLAGLREFLKYMGSRDAGKLYLYSQAKEIPKVPGVKVKVKGLSKNAVKALVEAPDIKRKAGRRDLAFITLMYNTAAGLDELLSLKIRDVNIGNAPGITVLGKKDKIRTIPILSRTVSHLERYIGEFHGDSPDPAAYVFYSRNGGLHSKLSQPAIDKMLKKYAAQAKVHCPDVPLTLHAHQLRHARATHWLDEGMNIVQISHLLGHAQVETTMVYLDISIEQTTSALETLLKKEDAAVKPKWKNPDGSLASFCACRKMKEIDMQ